jgi:glycerol-3-phosphate dehydrogenase (NAD(P)+)
MSHMAVLGEGSMGTTIADTAAANGHRCVLWCSSETVAKQIQEKRRHPTHFPTRQLSELLTATHRMEDAVHGASLVIVAIASPRFREVARFLGGLTMPEQVVLSATKGFELSTLKRMSELLADELKTEAIGVISGPNVTPDIMAGQLTAIVVASHVPDVIKRSAQTLQTPQVRVYGNDDISGVEIAGVLKNAAAIAMGIATGLNWSSNTRSFLFTRGLAEIRHLGLALGSKPDTFYGLAGLGDLFLTSTSADSLNYRVGIELAQGKPLAEVLGGMKEVPEGINSTRGCCALARRAGVLVPLASRTLQIIEGEMRPSSLEDALISPQTYGVDHDAVC